MRHLAAALLLLTTCPSTSANILDICGAHHYGCHTTLSSYSASAVSIELTNDNCASGTVASATEKDGYGSGTSLCWDSNYHGSQKGPLIGDNPYSISSVITTVAEQVCGALLSTRLLFMSSCVDPHPYPPPTPPQPIG